MPPWQLWSESEPIQEINGFEPLLASWNKSSDPAQIRLRAYLDNLLGRLNPLPPSASKLTLHLEVDVHRRERLLHHYDLENYLTPLFGTGRLDARRFVLVSACKRIGGGSQLRLGLALPRAERLPPTDWGHCACKLTGSTGTKAWKEYLRACIAATAPEQLPPGEVEVQMAWRCSNQRNWSNLWKPTSDAMGPVLGEPDSRRPFGPSDDRITSLSLHLNTDPSLGYTVDAALWWRKVQQHTTS
jgi:hypothetical protein